MQKSNVIGINLAKTVIQVCVVSADGELVSNKAVSPRKLKEILAKTKPSIVTFGAGLPSNLHMKLGSLAREK
jgi:transposase